MPSLLQRLKQRKLIQWTLAYLAGALVVFEATGTVLEAWNIPPLLVRAIHVLLVVGFFLTLVIAWYHGEKGHQKVTALEVLIVAALLGGAVMVLSLLQTSDEEPALGSADSQEVRNDKPSILVLVCENISPDPNDAFLADGLHGEIINNLAHISGLISRGRETAKWYRDNPSIPSEIASREGLDFVGECSVRKDPQAGQVLITFTLLDAGEAPTWSHRYEEDLTTANLFEIQSDIAREIANRVGVTLTPEEFNRLQARPTANLGAYELYLRGRTRWMMRQEGLGPVLQEAIEFFEMALAQDPQLALAHAGLAQAYMILPGHSSLVNVHEALEAARKAATEALTLEPDLPEAHAALGFVAFAYDWEWSEAEERFRRAIDLNPGNAETRAWYSGLLLALGRDDQAHEQAEIALELDPFSWSATLAMMDAPGKEGVGEGIQAGQRYLSHFPNSPGAHLNLFMLLLEESRFEEAAEEAALYSAGFREILPPDSLRALGLAMGSPTTFDHALDLLRFVEGRVLPGLRTGLAPFYARLGDSERALELARELIDERGWLATQLGDSWWAPLYDDPRYLALLDEVGLPHPTSGS
jgi:TolB-like protein/tetratricopeptide (TPR) repeat protein